MNTQITDQLFEEIGEYLTPTSFKKGEYIPLFQNSKREIALIKTGEVFLMKSDVNGNLLYLDRFKDRQIFSRIWIYNEDNDLFLVCKKNTEIYFLDYALCMQKNNPKIMSFLFENFISYTNYLNQKITILQKKNMEEKLLSYFKILKKETGQKKFEIPISYKDLADYLGVNRSSLMRKLNDLEKKKKIKRQGRTIFWKS